LGHTAYLHASLIDLYHTANFVQITPETTEKSLVVTII